MSENDIEQLKSDVTEIVWLLERIARRAQYASALPEHDAFRIDFCRSVLRWIESVDTPAVPMEITRLEGWFRFMIAEFSVYEGAPDAASAYAEMAKRALAGDEVPA